MLLNQVLLRAGDAALRPVEVEAYYTGPGHADPFAHADPVQAGCRVWYFHRRGGSYRGGSFKGLDLVFGPPAGRGGLLLRALERDDGAVIDGPSLCVDHLLACTGHTAVADLDAAIAGRDAWDPRSPLHLAPADLARREPLATPRVGLTLKRVAEHPSMPAFLDRHYRWLTRPRAIKKGRPQTIRGLAALGHDVDAIRAATGSPRPTIAALLGAPDSGFGV